MKPGDSATPLYSAGWDVSTGPPTISSVPIPGDSATPSTAKAVGVPRPTTRASNAIAKNFFMLRMLYLFPSHFLFVSLVKSESAPGPLCEGLPGSRPFYITRLVPQLATGPLSLLKPVKQGSSCTFTNEGERG